MWCDLAILVSSVWVQFWVCVGWPAAGGECSRLAVVKLSRFCVWWWVRANFWWQWCVLCVCVVTGGGVLCGSGRELQNLCSE